MLNCCILHKISTEHKTNTHNATLPPVAGSSDQASTTLDTGTSTQPTDQQCITTAHSYVDTTKTSAEDISSGDEEFYEAPEEMLNESNDHVIQSSDHVIQSSDHVIQSDDHVTGDIVSPPWEGREGVLHQYQDLVLMATGDPLCVPITQVTH